MIRLKEILRILLLIIGLAVIPLSQADAKVYGLSGTSPAPAFNFIAAAAHITTPDGGSLLFWGFGDASTGVPQYPGPTLIVNEGDTVTINLTNYVTEPVSMTFPGLDVTSPQGAVFPMGDRTQLTSVVPEAAPNGGTRTYTFTASRPGTFYYQSGSNQPIQLRMGLFGAIVVRPAQNGTPMTINDTDYRFLRGLYTLATGTTGTGITKTFTQFGYNDGDGSTGYDREFLFITSDMDPAFHSWMEFGGAYDISTWKANYWFINGRCGPDTMDMPNVGNLPYQPYNALPSMHPGEVLLVRYVAMGRDLHPFHTHGNHVRVVATDGNLLSTAATSTTGADLSWMAFTLTHFPGKTIDGTFTWTGSELNWDAYGHKPGDPPEPYEYLADHGKQFTPNLPPINDAAGLPVAQGVAPAQGAPVLMPSIETTIGGLFWSGSPYLGSSAPVVPGEGGFNPSNGFFFMWHSHAERELTNNDIFPGGMLTMLGVLPWSATIVE
jgi:FtsP/CotA-like multicopper oxidase with cupredoxin domain